MREGTVKFQGYRAEGVYCKPGLRNRRRATWAKILRAQRIEKERKAEEKLARELNAPQDYGYDEWYGREGGSSRDSDSFGSDRIVTR